MCPIDFGVKGQKSRSQCNDCRKSFMLHTFVVIAFRMHLSSWNFIQGLPMGWRCAFLILGSKSQRSRSQCINSWSCFIAHNWFPFTTYIMKIHTKTPIKDVPTWFLGQKVKGQGHNALIPENVAHNCFPFTPKHHKTSHKNASLVEGVPYWFRGQRPRSQCIDFVKKKLHNVKCDIIALSSLFLKCIHLLELNCSISPRPWIHKKHDYCLYFCPPPFAKAGDIKTHFSVCLSVCLSVTKTLTSLISSEV